MAAVTAPGGGSLLGKVAGIAIERAKVRRKASRVAAFLADHLLTACALGAGVAAAWLHGETWGLCSLVPALLVLDFKVRGLWRPSGTWRTCCPLSGCPRAAA